VNWFVAKLRSFMLGNLLPILAGMLSWSMFPRRSNHSNEDRLYKEFRGSPKRLFSVSVSNWRPRMPPMPGGMVPSRWFCPSTKEVSYDKLASNTGMLPVRLLFHKSSSMRRISSSPNSGGTRPWSWLDQRAMNIRLMQELRLAGSSPEKALLLRSRAWRRCRQPWLAGMPPVMNQLELRLRSLRDDRLPTAGERTPVSPWEGRLRETTRLRLAPHFIPSQLQNPPALPFQEASMLPWPPTAAALKASSAASSLACAGRSVVMRMEADSRRRRRLTDERIVFALLCCGRSTIVNGASEVHTARWCYFIFLKDGRWCYLFWMDLHGRNCQRPQLICEDINRISTHHSLFLSFLP